MSFDSLDHVLEAIALPNSQQHCLLEAWHTVVKPQVARHTRPLYVQRQVLWVATASSVWAQTLSLQRYSLLKKLNAQLDELLVEIRFSPAQWHQSSPASPDTASREHPSHLEREIRDLLPQLPAGDNPHAAFQRWATTVQARSHSLPGCPQCQCPTPPGELQRWGMCIHCLAKQ
ncbi:MAG: DciA family protein [Cyanophyceae cyanobacterium]